MRTAAVDPSAHHRGSDAGTLGSAPPVDEASSHRRPTDGGGRLPPAHIGGWAKAAWTLFVIVLPFLGVFMYVITQGGRMAERHSAELRASGHYFNGNAHNDASRGPSDQIAKGKELLDSGAIDQAEFELLKRKALA